VRLFGYCLSPFGEDCDEWGYASLAELQATRVRGLTIERDLHFPIPERTVAHALNRSMPLNPSATPTPDNSKETHMDLVLKLRELRRLRGFSQKDAARLSGVGEKTISSFETGERVGALKLSQLAKLLRIYGVTEEQFFSRAIEELFDPDAISRRSREERLLASLAELAPDARNALLDRFELMLDSAHAVRGATRPPEPRSFATAPHAHAA
jgi:transcriptional regulator with XRE-family HTH domain